MSSGMVMAQCPDGKTAFIVVNGVREPTEDGWRTKVKGIGDNFLATHSTLAPCVVFVPVYNNSQGPFGVLDFSQSGVQWMLGGVEAGVALLGFHFVPNINDPDYLKIVDQVN